jgi:hypothetical protein
MEYILCIIGIIACLAGIAWAIAPFGIALM